MFAAAGMEVLRVKIEASLHGADGDDLPDDAGAARELMRRVRALRACAHREGARFACVRGCVVGVGVGG